MRFATIGDGADPSTEHRLPRTALPRRYELRLAPDLDAARFTGTLLLEAEAPSSLTKVIMNAAELAIYRARVAPLREGPWQEAAAELDEERERLVLRFEEPVPAGPLFVDLAFEGTLNDKLHGFYRSTFIDEAGATRTIATTQFEATDARRAFPCFDEPDAKAVFSVTLDVPEGLAAYSNGELLSEEPLGGGLRRVRFADTIPMSTYLVAFVVGPLEATEPMDVDGTPLRVVHVPGKSHLTPFALEAGAHALRFFRDFFGIDYPASKLDLVAIPDFAFGAMENLGCVTFRESALLVDEGRASRLELERVADVISHEIAHMWFGDLVTMRWWNGIWLNEAFATFMELLCVDHFRPEWERWVSFGVEREVAMATDALHSTRPVEYPVGPPEEAQGMFDVLTYQKGASVLRMLERYIGAKAFRDGIRLYLNRHRLSNTETEDLWDAIEEASGQPVRSIMDTWIRQGGFPVVNVARDQQKGALRLSQAPFSYAPRSGESSIGSAWIVPVTARLVGEPNGGGEKRLLLSNDQAELEEPQAPLVVNAHGSGFYRVEYSPDLASSLAERYGSLEALERFNLLSDTWASVVAGHAGLDAFVSLCAKLPDEDDPDVWSVVAGAASLLDHALDGPDRDALASLVRAVATPAFERLGWEASPGEPERRATLRASLLGMLGTVGQDRAIQEEARRRHEAGLAGKVPLDPNLASSVVNVVATSGGPEDFDAFVDLYRKAPTPQEEVRYLYALGAFEQVELARRAFDMALREVRTQNAPFLVQVLLANRASGPAIWPEVEQNFEAMLAKFPTNIVPRMLEGVKALCRDEALVERISSFLRDHPVPSGERSVKQTMERLQVNAELARRLKGSAARGLLSLPSAS